MTTKNEYMSKLMGQAVTVLVTIVISMSGFWMMVGRDFTTRDEVNTIVNTKIIAIDNKLEERAQRDVKLENVLEKNTEAIHGLQIQIATLNVMLETMRRDKDEE